ncbi:Gfo/Idh/MocA family oxidoreductase [Paenarthrobacter sp. Z7-10]|uniref:Gfo/Idh/MocA family protein n=1 Tax=Paenarthrobacter sp. Z7-10 TaxID=2787635 RepID=UPI0022A8FB1D|nr:Gfo/Idh/MocA family oxidoreductase [Paenarthrobacter sp. Z7-10]MCZ2403029.1 Gfo/Idh/MocA family oxidoreductase [Paenarthrobacter sp. Z7-10]
MTGTRPISRPEWLTAPEHNTFAATGRTLRWGVVATGNIANTVTAELALLEDAELVAVSSRSQAKASEFAARFGFARHYYDGGPGSGVDVTDHSNSTGGGGVSNHGFATGGGTDQPVAGYQQLVRDPDLDVVYVATPHGQHFEVVRAALQAGKHVLCEKALTVNAAEAAELIRLARERKLFLMEAVWARFVPGMQRAFEIAASGEIGKVQWVRADLGFPAPVDPTARIWAPVDGGGALLDLSVYPLLWAWGTLGAPQSVHASGALTDFGVDRQNAITLSYASGAQAQLMSSLTALGPRSAVVAGSKGYIEAAGSINNPLSLTVQTGVEEPRVETFEPLARGYTYQLREVTRCIQQGLTESPTMPLDDSLATMELFDEVRRQLGVVYPNDA